MAKWSDYPKKLSKERIDPLLKILNSLPLDFKYFLMFEVFGAPEGNPEPGRLRKLVRAVLGTSSPTPDALSKALERLEAFYNPRVEALNKAGVLQAGELPF